MSASMSPSLHPRRALRPPPPPASAPRIARMAPRPAVSLPQVGDVVAEKYELVRVLGKGGMAVVFEARHVRLHQRLALKVMHPSLLDQTEVVARFEREARAAAQLQSLNAARVIDVDVMPTGLPFIVLEYLEGNDLGEELAKKGALPIELAVDFVVQAATAMTEAHARGIVHRDLKPQNLFLCRAGRTPRKLVKVLDFGISKMMHEATRLTGCSASIGTPEYMSPEQIRATEDVDARTDVWSLGVILFELIVGHTPFVGRTEAAVHAAIVMDTVPNPASVREACPVSLGRAVLRMLEKDPARRVQSMAEVIELLTPFAPRERIGAVLAETPRAGGRLGEILIADGLLTPAQLERALAEQRRTGQLLGRALLDLELVSQPDLMTALAKQQGIADARPSDPARPSPRERWPRVVMAVLAIAIVAVFGCLARL